MPPGLIILDICMPTGIGLSVAERFKEHGLDTPVIFLTAVKTPGLHKAAAEVGAAGFLEKSYDPAELLTLIQQTLDARTPALTS